METVLGARRGGSGYRILEELGAKGWAISLERIAGDRIRLAARRGGVRVEAAGASVEHAAPFLLERARRAAVAA